MHCNKVSEKKNVKLSKSRILILSLLFGFGYLFIPPLIKKYKRVQSAVDCHWENTTGTQKAEWRDVKQDAFLIRVYAQSCLRGMIVVRESGAEKINKNFGRDTNFGVFERKSGASEFSSDRMRYQDTDLLRRSAHHKLNNIESPVRRLQQSLCLPSERKTWVLNTLLKGQRGYCELVHVF